MRDAPSEHEAEHSAPAVHGSLDRSWQGAVEA